MILNWRWFSGGKTMFWVSLILLIFLLLSFGFTYFIDITTLTDIKVQNIDSTSIKDILEKYVESYGIAIDKPIVYRFVKYEYNKEIEDDILLGTFHEWNSTYYIDILSELYGMNMLYDIVIHETRHMIIEYLRDKNIIDLTEYTEEIARGDNTYYNNLFDSGIYLLKNQEETENG